MTTSFVIVAAVSEFLAGEDIEEIEDVETEPAADEEGVDYYIVITDSSGEEIERIPVGPDEDPSISFESPDGTEPAAQQPENNEE